MFVQSLDYLFYSEKILQRILLLKLALYLSRLVSRTILFYQSKYHNQQLIQFIKSTRRGANSLFRVRSHIF